MCKQRMGLLTEQGEKTDMPHYTESQLEYLSYPAARGRSLGKDRFFLSVLCNALLSSAFFLRLETLSFTSLK